jgi:hypothetical protein
LEITDAEAKKLKGVRCSLCGENTAHRLPGCGLQDHALCEKCCTAIPGVAPYFITEKNPNGLQRKVFLPLEDTESWIVKTERSCLFCNKDLLKDFQRRLFDWFEVDNRWESFNPVFPRQDGVRYDDVKRCLVNAACEDEICSLTGMKRSVKKRGIHEV